MKTTKSPAEEGHAAYATSYLYEHTLTHSGAVSRLAIGAAEDPILMAETFNRVLNENDGLVDWLLYALTAHPKSRRPMAQFFKDNYDAVSAVFLS